MLLQIFGLVDQPSWWRLNRIPDAGGQALADILANRLAGSAGMEFYCDDTPLASFDASTLAERWSNNIGYVVAKPRGSAQRHRFGAQLSLITTAGPDAGRMFPLSRRRLSVGRGSARAQVRDPWLSAHAFDIRLSSNGTVVAPRNEPEFLWESGQPYELGSTLFAMQGGVDQPLKAPEEPAPFVIDPGQPPSPPNVVLQVIGAAAPLLIGIVLMVVTGMWYFLLFSGISVIIAAVMITQYRRARQRFIAQIHRAIDEAADSMRGGVFAPHDMTTAVRSSGDDPLALAGTQPDHPVLYFGVGKRKATLHQMQQAQRWDEYLIGTVPLIVSLVPKHRVVVVGDDASLRPVRNWCVAQLLRHAKATHSGFLLDGRAYADPALVLVSDTIDSTSELPQLIFTSRTGFVADEHTTVIDLYEHTVNGSLTATALQTVGISAPTLHHLGRHIDLEQPDDLWSPDYLTVSATTMRGSGIDQLETSLGTGALGLTIDLVRDGPHLLISGTTGSGKSELLLTVLVGMTEQYPPTEIGMILMDFKGGSSFNVLKPLPHTMSVETNHVAATSFRSLDAIAAELHRRELLFTEYNVPDYVTFRKTYPQEVLPRLIVAIDELRILVDDNQDAAQALARLAATGRSLGFHLILATQRTQGAVNSDMRANIGATISLRTATEHDSWELLGTADAFHIPATLPGRAYYKTGAEPPRVFQTARYMLDDEPVTLVAHRTHEPQLVQPTTDWDALVKELQSRADHLPIASPVILPALPQRIGREEMLSRSQLPAQFEIIGLIDNPAQRSQYPLALGPKTSRDTVTSLPGSVAWVGTADSGLATATTTVCDHVLRRTETKVLLDGGRLVANGDGWDRYLHVTDASPDVLQELTQWMTELVAEQHRLTVVITDWGGWATQMVTGHFQGFEDVLIQLLRQYASILTLYIFGARELAGGRMIAMIPDRVYLPMNSSAEHRMIWPKLIAVPAVAARGVVVTAEQPTGGLAVQLC